MPQPPIEDLLRSLDAPNSQEAWSQFLSDYSAHIYQVVRHFESNPDNAADCFQFVCEQLIEKRSKRLRKFRGDGTATFVTWLRAVVRNLCVDWHRKASGRHRQFLSISRLPILDREVFRLIYEGATSQDQCLTLLRTTFPNITATQIDESRTRIDQSLTVNQRWLLTKRFHSGNGNDIASLDQPESFLAGLTDSHPDPETQAINNERKRILQRALEQLQPNERLLIRLRFEEGLTLTETAVLLGLGNAQRVDRQIQEILARLFKLVG